MAYGLENKLVKKAHSATKYTEIQVKELQQCMDPDKGPLYFISNFMYIRHPVKGRMRMQPYWYQKELMEV